MLFCQLDVTGRTEPDPAAESLARNLLGYVSAWKPAPVARSSMPAIQPASDIFESAGILCSRRSRARTSLPTRCSWSAPAAGRRSRRSAAGHRRLAQGRRQPAGHRTGRSRTRTPSCPARFARRRQSTSRPTSIRSNARSLLAGVGPADVHNRDPRELPLITAGATVFGDGVLARAEGVNVVFCQIAPWQFEYDAKSNLKRTYRRASLLVSRLLANMGVDGATPILSRFMTPVAAAPPEQRWQNGLYLDQPEEWDDPYRFFRW